LPLGFLVQLIGDADWPERLASPQEVVLLMIPTSTIENLPDV
jgi:hypothetical protein